MYTLETGSDCMWLYAVTWWWETADLLHMLHISCMEGLMLHCTVLSLDLSPFLPHSAATSPPLLNIC